MATGSTHTLFDVCSADKRNQSTESTENGADITVVRVCNFLYVSISSRVLCIMFNVCAHRPELSIRNYWAGNNDIRERERE